MKGKPWTMEEEASLRAHVEAKTPLPIIAAKLGKKPAAVSVKCQRLGLTPSSHAAVVAIPLPSELPSVEETLKKLAGALDVACGSGLSKLEVQRLQVVSTLAKTYKETLAD